MINHEHHDGIRMHLEQLVALAAMVGRVETAELDAPFQEQCGFVTGHFVPHMTAVETTLYDDLERLMEHRYSLEPMREEHERIRQLVASLCRYGAAVADGSLTSAEAIGLRRVLYRLSTILTVHLDEEELYLGVLEQESHRRREGRTRARHRTRCRGAAVADIRRGPGYERGRVTASR